MSSRMCSEWGLRPQCKGSLEGMSPKAKTCSVGCRQHRGRRLKAAGVDPTALEATQGVRELVRAGGQDAVQQVLKQELAPLVRESIDESVLAAIDKMVKLTPAAVEVLAKDMESEDAVMRQRAAALVVKYTIGHPALVRPPEEKPSSFTVNFGLPRPDAAGAGPTADAELDPEDVQEAERVCDNCHKPKPLSEFADGSDRCEECFQAARRAIIEKFGLDVGT